jgi:hypothetical protein
MVSTGECAATVQHGNAAEPAKPSDLEVTAGSTPPLCIFTTTLNKVRVCLVTELMHTAMPLTCFVINELRDQLVG